MGVATAVAGCHAGAPRRQIYRLVRQGSAHKESRAILLINLRRLEPPCQAGLRTLLLSSSAGQQMDGFGRQRATPGWNGNNGQQGSFLRPPDEAGYDLLGTGQIRAAADKE